MKMACPWSLQTRRRSAQLSRRVLFLLYTSVSVPARKKSPYRMCLVWGLQYLDLRVCTWDHFSDFQVMS